MTIKQSGFRTSPFARRLLLTVFAALLAVGCAPLDDEESPEPERTVSTTPEASRGESADDGAADADESTDKALRKSYCCVWKRGSRVNACHNVFGTKARLGVDCEAVFGDNVLRSGICEQYETCDGKISNPG